MPLQPRPGVEKMELCAHGGINFAELAEAGLRPEAVLDFSECTNPFMPPPGTEKALAEVDFSQYPDSQCTRLRSRLAGKLSLAPDHILAGNGTTELIRLAALAYFRPGDRVLIPEPTFGEYETACRLHGAASIKHWTGTASDVPGIIEAISATKPGVLFVCNPNNPTGRYLARSEIAALVKAMKDGLLVLDEAYVNFVSRPWNALDLIECGNLLVLRSMTKDYGLAGLRLGYAVSTPDIIGNLRRVCPPWNVNSAAQAAGIFALDNDEYLAQTVQATLELKGYLVDAISKLGFTVLPSDAHYFLVKVGNAPVFRRSLLKHGILVRDCSSFGLPEYIRIAPRLRPACDRLIQEMSRLMLRCGNKRKDGGEL